MMENRHRALRYKFPMPITGPDEGEKPEDHKAKGTPQGVLSSGSEPLLGVDARWMPLRKVAEVTD